MPLQAAEPLPVKPDRCVAVDVVVWTSKRFGSSTHALETAVLLLTPGRRQLQSGSLGRGSHHLTVDRGSHHLTVDRDSHR